MKAFKHFLISACILLFLTGCSMFSPVSNDVQATYELNTTPHITAKKTRPVTIAVLQPEINSIYNTTRIAYRSKPYQISYFAKNRWAETPSKMLHLLIVETLQNTHYFRAVIAPPFIGRYDYVLATQILELQQDFMHNPSLLRLTVRAQLIQTSTNSVVASKQFNIVERAPQNTPYGGVVAANWATAELLRQLATFCMR